MSEVFIAYEFPDPWASRMIDVDQDLELLFRRLAEKKVLVTPYGPTIYVCEAGEDPQTHGTAIAQWKGTAGVLELSPVGVIAQLMRSEADFVRRFYERRGVSRVWGGDHLGPDGKRKDDAAGRESAEGRREERGDGEVDGRERVHLSFFDVS